MCEAKFTSWIEDEEIHIAVEIPDQEGKLDEKAVEEWIQETISKAVIEAVENHAIYGSRGNSDRNADRT